MGSDLQSSIRRQKNRYNSRINSVQTIWNNRLGNNVQPAVVQEVQQSPILSEEEQAQYEEYLKNQEEINKSKSEIQQQIDSLRAQIDDYTFEINQLQSKRPNTNGPNDADTRLRIDSRINALNKARGVVANQYDKLNVQANILSDSGSLTEASARQSLYNRQVQYQEYTQTSDYKNKQKELQALYDEGEGYSNYGNFSSLPVSMQKNIIIQGRIAKDIANYKPQEVPYGPQPYIPDPFSYQVPMTKEQMLKLQEFDYQTKFSNYMKTINPIHETYNPDVIMSPQEIGEFKQLMALKYAQDVREGKIKTFGQRVGDLWKLDVDIPIGFGVAKGLTYNPYETEQWLEKQREETSIGKVEKMGSDLIKDYGDTYGNVSPNDYSEKGIEEFNKRIEDYNKAVEYNQGLEWYQGLGQGFKYYGLKGLQLLNPESVGELGLEAGAVAGGIYAYPYVSSGLSSLSAQYPLTMKGIEAGFFGKNIFDAYKGIKEADWKRATSGVTFATLQTIPYVINALNKWRLGGIEKSKTTIAEFEKEKKALEKVYTKLKGTKREIGNLRLDRVKEIQNSPKAHKIIKDFIVEKKLTVGGTSGIEMLKTSKGQLTLVRQPRDLELFSKAGLNKYKLARDLTNRLKVAGFDVSAQKRAVIFNKVGGHGINFQKWGGLNLERYTGKIYTGPEGIQVADPIGISYNKVFDLLKRVRASGSKAKQLLAENPEAYNLAKYKGYVYVRYPKDSTGAIDTARQVLKTQIDDFTNFAKRNIPIHQETQLAKYLKEQQRLKPYLSKLANEEAKIIPYFYKGPEPRLFAGYKDPRFFSSTMERLRRLGEVSNRPTFMLTGLPPPAINNQYRGSPYTSSRVFNYPFLATGYYGKSPSSYNQYPTGNYPVTPVSYPPNYSVEYPKIPPYPTGYTGYYPPYTPPEITTVGIPPTTPDKKQEPKRRRKRKGEPQYLAYQTIYYTDDGKKIEGRVFPNKVEATAEGFEVVDKTPLNKFNVKRIIAKRELLSRHMGTKVGYKFKGKGNIYIEKVPYRKDKKMEKGGNFNIMPYVFNSH